MLMDSANSRVDSLVREVQDLKTSLQFSQNEIDSLKVEIKDAKKSSNVDDESAVAKKVDYLENQSRRNNIVIDGIEGDNSKETWAETEGKVRDLLTKNLKLEAKDIEIERAHRNGVMNKDNPRPRQVVVRLLRYKDKQLILNQARSHLKNTPIYINEDFSEAVRKRRAELLPELKAARSRGEYAVLSYDKLVIRKKPNPNNLKSYLTLPSDQSDSVEVDWSVLRGNISKAAEDVVGYCSRSHQDWFDQNDSDIRDLIDLKRSARLAWENRPTRASLRRFKKAKQECQRRVREMQNLWWQDKAKEIQSYADNRDLRRFYAATKETYGPRRGGTNNLLTADGMTALTDDQAILNRRKAPGPDSIPLELISHGGIAVQTSLFILILRMWETKVVPADLKDATIITIFKKGDRSICGNYRGISLLSIAGKIFARILLDRLLTVAEEVLPESQCGFRPSRGTTDMIFCARLLQEKSREQRQPLFLVFWDLEKAFDSVPRPAMWATLRRFGCPDHFTDLVQALHDGMTGRVAVKNTMSEPFAITTGLKQGCVLAPTLFSLYLGAMIHELPDNASGIQLRYRMDGGLFNTGRLRSRRHTTSFTVRELQYADDNATPVDTVDALQSTVDVLDGAYSRFGLTSNIGKTKILAQGAPGHPPPDTSNIRLRGEVLETVKSFPYLGSFLSDDCTMQKDIDNRIRAAHAAFGRLSKRVFLNHDLSLQTKIMVFQAIVLSTLLYGCEVWVLYRRDVKKLERFQQQKLRAILKIKWQDRVSNEAVLLQAKLPSIETTMARHRLRWAGHVKRMPTTRLPRQILYSQLESGTRSRGAPKRRFRDQLKATLLRCDIDHTNWETLAENRSEWRRTITQGTDHMEQLRRSEAETKRQQRKERLLLPRSPPTLPCTKCPRLFHTALGLSSHLRHRHQQSANETGWT
ncbi:uncharacterized protein LOC118427017 [Branchiostoma floridae]|uniref:Uncharacterized protein LOC118427017 n=1 Tax=Branchiostoma floridae TaxID=7739 RepID=A0A9J7M0M0_BRAFL|nr:uncharacterized protein LOC118427017 [Branchiostoma floridae]